MSISHIPVLLQPACQLLDIRPGKRYIDATLGLGGHSAEIIKRGGIVLGIDQDAEALQPALASVGDSRSLTAAHGNFMLLGEIARRAGFDSVDGILFDLGVSSLQLDQPLRGFSFQHSGPLDMRMDSSHKTTAADLVNSVSQPELTDILKKFGDISQAASLSAKIIAARPLVTTADLAAACTSDSQRRRVFQALRIAVNGELFALDAALPQALELLKPEGRLVVISFHSGEDRIIKNYFRQWQKQGLGRILTPRPLTPSPDEVKENPRSKSSKLRALTKIYA